MLPFQKDALAHSLRAPNREDRHITLQQFPAVASQVHVMDLHRYLAIMYGLIPRI